MSFGQYLKEQRKQRGMSQRLLAQLIDSSNTEISRIEQEIRQKPSPVMLKKIAEVMDIPIDEIMREAGYTPHSSTVVQKLQSEKKIFEIIEPHLEKNGYASKQEYLSEVGAYSFTWDCVAINDAQKIWALDFIYLLDEQKSTTHPIQIEKIFKDIGLASVDTNISKLSFVFNNEVLFNNCKNIIPKRIDLDISLILIDMELNTVLQESFL